MTVTGERVTTAAGGFNPTFQRHVAAYLAAAGRLPDGRVLDLGAGIGHSFELLAPRETVGLDLDTAALAGQDRRTVVADMRAVPFADATFDSVLAVHSLEHVPDPASVVAEAWRVLRRGGTAMFVTPNRLTFGRPDEIIDPYHHVEYDAEQLRALCAARFDDVELLGLFGSPRYQALVDAERRRLDRLLALDPLRARRLVPRRVRQLLYDALLTRARREPPAEAAAIDAGEDFSVQADGLDGCLDVIAVCRKPGTSGP